MDLLDDEKFMQTFCDDVARTEGTEMVEFIHLARAAANARRTGNVDHAIYAAAQVTLSCSSTNAGYYAFACASHLHAYPQQEVDWLINVLVNWQDNTTDGRRESVFEAFAELFHFLSDFASIALSKGWIGALALYVATQPRVLFRMHFIRQVYMHQCNPLPWIRDMQNYEDRALAAAVVTYEAVQRDSRTDIKSIAKVCRVHVRSMYMYLVFVAPRDWVHEHRKVIRNRGPEFVRFRKSLADSECNLDMRNNRLYTYLYCRNPYTYASRGCLARMKGLEVTEPIFTFDRDAYQVPDYLVDIFDQFNNVFAVRDRINVTLVCLAGAFMRPHKLAEMHLLRSIHKYMGQP